MRFNAALSSLVLVAAAIAGPARAAESHLIKLNRGEGGPMSEYGGAGNEQGDVVVLTNNDTTYVMTVYMSSENWEQNEPWQCKCASVRMNADGAPTLIANRYVTVDRDLPGDGEGERPCNHPALASTGDIAIMAYGSDADHQANVQVYAKALDTMCSVVSGDPVLLSNHNGNQGAAGIACASGTHCVVGYNNNGQTGDAVGVTVTRDGSRINLATTFRVTVVNPANIPRPSLVALGTTRVLYTAAQGDQRPPEDGARVALLDATTGTIVWSEIPDVARSNPEAMVYINSPALAKLDDGNVAMLVDQSNGRGKNTNDKGSARTILITMQPDEIGPNVRSVISSLGSYQAHAGLCSGSYGTDATMHAAIFEAPISGTSIPMATLARFDPSQGLYMGKSEVVAYRLADSGYIANQYGANPNNQGRDFLKCIGDVPNPSFGINGGFMPDVQTFFAMPFAGGGNEIGEDKNAMFLSFLPGRQRPLAPEAPEVAPLVDCAGAPCSQCNGTNCANDCSALPCAECNGAGCVPEILQCDGAGCDAEIAERPVDEVPAIQPLPPVNEDGCAAAGGTLWAALGVLALLRRRRLGIVASAALASLVACAEPELVQQPIEVVDTPDDPTDDIVELPEVEIPDPGTVDQEDGLTAFEQTVKPIMTAKCASCHVTSANFGGEKFLGPSPETYYAVIKSYGERYVSANPSTSMLITRAGVGQSHYTVFTQSETTTVLDWLAIEASVMTPVEPEPTDPPPTMPSAPTNLQQALYRFGSCMQLTTWNQTIGTSNDTNIAMQTATFQGNTTACNSCHNTGTGATFLSSINSETFDMNRVYPYILRIVQGTVDPSTGAFQDLIVSDRFMMKGQEGCVNPDVGLCHPTYTLSTAREDALRSFVNQTLERYHNYEMDCGKIPVTYETERMSLSGEYTLDAGAGNSRIRIRANSTPPATGTAAFSFTGGNGDYNMYIHLVAENDGTPSLDVRVGGTSVSGFPMVYPLGNAPLEDLPMGPYPVTLTRGAVIQLIGTSNAAAYARIDKVVFEPL
jgi:hypothetical protein